MRRQIGLGLFVPFFPHMSVFDGMVDMFLSTWRSEISRGLPWLQSALLEWLCSAEKCMECPYI